MTTTTITRLSLIVATLSFAGCNAAPLLQTGSLSAITAATPAAPKVVTPVDRAFHVAATSARAEKCGFFFDPVSLRTNYLAAEGQRGTPPDMLAKAEQSYDYTAKSVAAKITDSEQYCTTNQTTVIKAALQSTLTGNFDPPAEKPPEPDSGIFGNLMDGGSATETRFNPNEIYDPLLNEPGKSTSED